MLNSKCRLKIMMWSIGVSTCLAINVLSQSAIGSPAKYNYLIDQMAQAGPHHIQVTDQGMRVDAPRLGFGIQYRTADNSVLLWSSKHHTYYVIAYDKWIVGFRNLFAAVSYYSELVKPIKVVTQKKGNLTFHVYNYHVDAQSPSYWSSDIGHKEAAEALQDIDFTTLDMPSKQASLMMGKLYGTPAVSGFPYTLHRMPLNASSLRTLKFDSAYTKPISFFVPTSDYKKVPFTNQIIGPSLDDNMTKMMLPY